MHAGLGSALWYGLQIGLAGRLRYPQAAVSVSELERGLELHYHSLGGALARRVVGDAGSQRRSLVKAVLSDGMLDLMAWLDQEQVHLPRVVDRYPTRALNRELYFWLAAFLAHEHPDADDRSLPLGIRHLLRGCAASIRLAQRYPPLGERYLRLCAAELEQRASVLPNWDAASTHPVLVLEAAIRYALGSSEPPRDEWLTRAVDAVRCGAPVPTSPPQHSHMVLPFLPVALWGHPAISLPGLRLLQFKRRMRRRDRGTSKALARPRFDPMHRPEPVTGPAAEGQFVYPEWQYQRRAYRPDWCVVTERLPSSDSRARSDRSLSSLAAQVRRQFEALRQLPGWNRRLESGDDLDLEAYVESLTDARGCGRRSSRVYRERARRWRDLSVAVVMDSSRSTEAWVGQDRVIGIARRSMLVLAEALAAAADDFALFAFASDSRLRVTCYRIKDFTEAYGESAQLRICALRAHQYTRMGAAIRHVGARLACRPHAQKLLLVLTDGRPNDPADGYEGRYALEDARRALLELRVRGVHCFGLTIDQRGSEYLPHLFGAGHYAVFADPRLLPRVLPRLYARITARAA
ncbi:MAG TPA: VWA domain-containing protein [Burkholderiales bacterium]|nr:VWA domain-containing protein [Burkholderiales bacterium]